MNDLLRSYSGFESEKIKINHFQLHFKSHNIVVKLTKKQRNILICLIGRVNKKEDIISRLWKSYHPSYEHRYNQLVYKLREKLQAAGCSEEVIITMHRYGLCLNHNLLEKENDWMTMDSKLLT